MIDYTIFNGRTIEDIADYIPDKSHYCHNYYVDVLGNEIFAESDDDDYTEYYYNGTQFAESFTSKGDLIEVFDEYLNMEKENEQWKKMKFRKYICKDGLSVDVGIVNLIQNVEKHIVQETRGVKISEGNPLVLEILVTIRQSNEKENKQCK